MINPGLPLPLKRLLLQLHVYMLTHLFFKPVVTGNNYTQSQKVSGIDIQIVQRVAKQLSRVSQIGQVILVFGAPPLRSFIWALFKFATVVLFSASFLSNFLVFI